MKNLLFIIFALLFLPCQAQQNGVIINNKEKKIEILVANPIDVPLEVTINIIKPKGLRGNHRPVTKIIQPRDTVQFYNFIAIGQPSYSYNISRKPLPEKSFFSERTEVDTENGTVLFYKPDCPRSQRTLVYLMENDKAFKIINTSEKEENRSFMWQVLKEKKKEPKDLLMPVVLVNGSVFYNYGIPEDFQKVFH